ncbi:MAG TPA: T9SS type A sorting domain-containing protein, partial [Saprospiraceae bacterium]|nr:T9SS type A sorting domain-containing protein [Saprospiraceae bacterium]
TVAPEIVFDAAVEPVKCFGEENAVVDISSNLVEDINSYSLVGAVDIAIVQDSPVFTDLPAGNYQIIVEDRYGCSHSRDVEVVQPEELVVEALDISPVSCPGENDAGLVVAARGGNANYQYSLDNENFKNINTFRNLSPGNYDLFVKDDKGCTTQQAFAIEEKPTPALEIKTQDISCPDETDGSFIVIIETIEGFYDNYEYSLDNEVFQKDSLFTQLDAGTYQVFAKSNTGCTFQQSVNIAAAPTPEIDFQVESPTCPDANDGSFIVIIETIEGYYNDYDYSIDGVNFQKDSLFENLSAGFYELTTRSNTGCNFQQTIEIQAPATPDITIKTHNVTCPDANDGSFIVIIETIEGFYQYSIDGVNFQKDSVFNSLPAGDYTLSIRNENNCIVTQALTITEPTAPHIEIEVQNESCAGDNDGQITINTTGGTGPFQYSINNGITFQNENVFTNLSPGIYTVIVKDANGCTFEKLVNISAAQALQVEFTINHATCNYDNGFIASIVTGGHFPYQYNWSGTNANEAVANNLYAGTYALTITDQSNCQLIQDSLEVLNENVPILHAEIRDANCHDEASGAIKLEVESDALPLKYRWSNGQTTKDISNLKADSYTVTVLDANKCSESKIYEVEEPEAINIDLELKQKLGKGFITAVVTGGVGNYRFLWSTGAKGNQIENLPAGNYSVTVIDDNTCTETIDIEFVVQVVKNIRDHIAIYPNPTNGDLTIDFSFPEEQMISYELIDELGRILLLENVSAITNEKKTLDLRNFPSAVYFLRINIGNDSIVEKLLKIGE